MYVQKMRESNIPRQCQLANTVVIHLASDGKRCFEAG